MPASRELMVLCQAQLSLLVESLGVSSAIVYLTESWDDGSTPRLQPIASVPIEVPTPSLLLFAAPIGEISNAAEKGATSGAAAMGTAATGATTSVLPSLEGRTGPQSGGTTSLLRNGLSDQHPPLTTSPSLTPNPSLSQSPPLGHQLVLPLLQDERVLGVLVAERNRPWDAQAQPQIDAIRQTLTAACVLDQRSQWFEQQATQQQVFQRQQKDLLDNLLHQFRNPLTAMRTFGKLLVKRLVETDRNREVAGSIVRESDRLQALLVQFESAIDAGEMTEMVKALQTTPEWSAPDRFDRPLPTLPGTLGRSLSLEPCDLQLILQPALQSARAVMDDRLQQLQVDSSMAALPVLVDPLALGEVLTNLLDNASKYTPQGGTIQVKLTEADDRAEIWITDSGYGIPPEDLPHLFERHYRGVQAQSNIPGTGLGLSIARELTRQMQGDIQVFSPPPKELSSEPVSATALPGTSIQLTLKKVNLAKK